MKIVKVWPTLAECDGVADELLTLADQVAKMTNAAEPVSSEHARALQQVFARIARDASHAAVLLGGAQRLALTRESIPK